MADEKPNGADVDLKLAGQEVRLRNVKSLNTLLTLAAAIGIGFAVYLLVEHKADAKASSDSLTAVMRDLATAVREGNCVNSYKEADREHKVEHCKMISR